MNFLYTVIVGYNARLLAEQAGTGRRLSDLVLRYSLSTSEYDRLKLFKDFHVPLRAQANQLMKLPKARFLFYDFPGCELILGVQCGLADDLHWVTQPSHSLARDLVTRNVLYGKCKEVVASALMNGTPFMIWKFAEDRIHDFEESGCLLYEDGLFKNPRTSR